jgi:hypothetical protein
MGAAVKRAPYRIVLSIGLDDDGELTDSRAYCVGPSGHVVDFRDLPKVVADAAFQGFKIALQEIFK